MELMLFVKSIYVPTLNKIYFTLYLDLQQQYIYMYKQTIKNLHRYVSTKKEHILSQKWKTT